MTLPNLEEQLRELLSKEEAMWREGKARAEDALARFAAGNPKLPDHALAEMLRAAFKTLDELARDAHVRSGGTDPGLLAEEERRATEIARFATSIAVIAKSQREARLQTTPGEKEKETTP